MIPEILSHVLPETTVWVSPACLENPIKHINVGKEVKVCGRDGWPEHCTKNQVLVRMSNTPPLVPTSTFDKGELVVSLNHVNEMWLGGEEGC